MTTRSLAALILILVLGFGRLAQAGHAELHAHLFMEEGMTWAFDGDFFGPLQAKDWRDKFSSQANPETVAASGIDVLVVSLYAHPLMTMSLRDSVRRQIELARRFVKENPAWVLAADAEQARRAIASGKRVLVLSLEGADGIIETEQDLVEFVDQGAIRIVTLLHLIDDKFGGVAFLKGLNAFSSPFALLRSFFSQTRDEATGVLVNGAGLTARGEALARALMKRKVWIDLAHSSDASVAALMPLLKKAGQPLLYTHTVLRHYHGAERGLPKTMLQAIGQSGGMIGLIPSEEYLEGTPIGAKVTCGSEPSALERLRVQYAEAVAVLGADAVAMGSDFNGGLRHLRPTCATGTSLDHDQGYWNIGQSKELWQALGKAGQSAQPRTAEHFIQAWSRLW